MVNSDLFFLDSEAWEIYIFQGNGGSNGSGSGTSASPSNTEAEQKKTTSGKSNKTSAAKINELFNQGHFHATWQRKIYASPQLNIIIFGGNIKYIMKLKNVCYMSWPL